MLIFLFDVRNLEEALALVNGYGRSFSDSFDGFQHIVLGSWLESECTPGACDVIPARNRTSSCSFLLEYQTSKELFLKMSTAVSPLSYRGLVASSTLHIPLSNCELKIVSRNCTLSLR